MPAFIGTRQALRLTPPLQPFADNFTRANGPLLGPWTAGATWAIASNVLVNTTVPGADVVVNGAMAADTDWGKGAGWAIAAGVATATAATSDLTASVAPLTTGLWYQTVFTITAFTGGTANVKLGTTALPTHGSTATFTEYGLATSTALAVTAAAATLSIDNVTCKPITLTSLLALVQSGTANLTATVPTTMSAGMQGGLALNWNSQTAPTSGVLAIHDTVSAYLYKCVAGTWTAVIAATAITYGAAKRIKVVKTGNTYSLFYGNAGAEAQVGTTQTIADAGIVNNTRHGVFATAAGVSLGAFTIL